jgi:hypothetical protein
LADPDIGQRLIDAMRGARYLDPWLGSRELGQNQEMPIDALDKASA